MVMTSIGNLCSESRQEKKDTYVLNMCVSINFMDSVQQSAHNHLCNVLTAADTCLQNSHPLTPLFAIAMLSPQPSFLAMKLKILAGNLFYK